MTADAGDLDQLREEAERRGVTLSVVLAEAVAAAAESLRSAGRPRFGLGHSGGVGAARASVRHPDQPYEQQPPR